MPTSNAKLITRITESLSPLNVNPILVSITETVAERMRLVYDRPVRHVYLSTYSSSIYISSGSNPINIRWATASTYITCRNSKLEISWLSASWDQHDWYFDLSDPLLFEKLANIQYAST